MGKSLAAIAHGFHCLSSPSFLSAAALPTALPLLLALLVVVVVVAAAPVL